MTYRSIWTSTRACLLASLATSVFTGCAATPPQADMQIVTGANFVTMTDATDINAMVIASGRIVELGDAVTLKARHPGATLLDFHGKTILPGFVDSHVHVRELGMDAIKVDLVGVKNMDDIVARIQEQRPDAPAGEWIIGQGWDEGAFADMGGPGGYPTTAALSDAFPDIPIALESLHGFGAMANRAALDRAGITKDTPNPTGGTILRDENGEATGVLLTLAQALLFDVVPDPDQAQIERAIIAGLKQMAAAGVTSVHEAGMTAQDVQAFRDLADQGQLPIRVFGMLNGNDGPLMADWFDSGPLDDPDDWLDIGGIKVFYDGSLGSRTALMLAPYSDRPDAARPTARISLAEVETLSQGAREKGFQMAVHAIGDAANDQILRKFADHIGADDAAQIPDHRWRIEHAQVVSPAFAQKAADLSVIASMQPSHAMGDSGWAEDRVGPDRIKRAYSWKTFQDYGVPIIFNSDLPGEPWTPMETLHFAITRTKLDGTPNGGWYANEALDRESSLRAMTLDGAHAAFQEDQLGSLSPGKWADFVVLSDNPMTAEDVLSIDVEATYVAGQPVRD